MNRAWGPLQRSFGIRPRLSAAFLILFVLTLVVTVIGVSGLRHTDRAIGEFEARVMPEIAKVLELAERVAQLAAVAPAVAENSTVAAFESDRAALRELLEDIRRLSGALPAQAEARLEAPRTFAGIDRDLGALVSLSHERRLLREAFQARRDALATAGDLLLNATGANAAGSPLLQSLWGVLVAAASTDDESALGRAEADAEALWVLLADGSEPRRHPAAARLLESLSRGNDNVFQSRRQLLRTERRLTSVVQLTRGQANELGERAGAYVAELRRLAREQRDSVTATARAGESTLLLSGAAAVAIAIVGLAYVNRVLGKMQAMTRVITRLAGGDVTQPIPAARQHDELGDLARAFLVFRDTLLEKERMAVTMAEQQLAVQARLDRMHKTELLGQLAGGIAHDFNNYLLPILGNLELIEPRLAGDAAAANWAARARRSAESAARLANRLLAFTRPQSAQRSVFAPADMLDEMIDLIEFSAGTAIEVTTATRADAAFVNVDRAQFESAVLNLVLNSAAAMPDGGSLSLQTVHAAHSRDVEPAGPAVGLCVTDTGHGIPEAVRDRVLEPFFTTKGPGKGNGLGLAIVQTFARQSAGSVVVRSEPGRGTAVEIWLPACAATASAVALAVPIERRWAGARVLLVEDDLEVRETVASMLGSLAIEVVAAESTAAAWRAWCRQSPFDLVLSDVNLGPGGDGVSLVQRIVEQRPAQRVALMSGLSQELPDRFEFIRKPFGAEQLAAWLDRLPAEAS